MEINNLLDKDFKVMAIKMFTKHGEAMNEHGEILIKKIGYVRKFQTEVIELKNTFTKPKKIH